MRNTLDTFLSKYNNPNLYFLHADMWGFKKFKLKYTLVNAGANGCYSKCGIGHLPDDDFKLMNALNVNCHEPTTRSEFLDTLIKCIRDTNTNFIRSGWDNCKW